MTTFVHRVTLRAFAAIALLSQAACSLLLDHTSDQCATSADCKQFQSNAVCLAGVCVVGTSDAGVSGDSGVQGDAGASDIDSGTADAGTVDAGTPDAGTPDAGSDLGPPGCFQGTPDADVLFYNACTNASYLVFDNCTRLGLCDGGAEPAIEKPDGGTTTTNGPLPDAGQLETCYDSTLRPNVIFMNGSTNFTPFIRVMAPIVAQSGYVIVWQPTSSCGGADTVFSTNQARRVMKNPVNSGQSYASYYTSTNTTGTPCLLGGSPASPAADTEYVDIGQSDIYATSCPVTNMSVSPFNTYLPGQGSFTDVRHYLGPIQSMVFVTPVTSSQKVISAEAARIVFGLGGNGSPQALPWVDKNFMWNRSATTGTTGIISRGIGVPATEFWGIDQRTAGNMVSQVKSASIDDAEKIIGLLSIDFADKEKNNLRMLYFQPRGALAGFLPDLHTYTRDKENVRDGHYPLWGPIHLYARAVGGDITPAAKAFITQFSVPQPDQRLLDATIETGNVPSCAMKVTRDTEMGPLREYNPTFQCHCYYEQKLNGGNGCQACSGPATCPTSRPACNLGFCEKQ